MFYLLVNIDPLPVPQEHGLGVLEQGLPWIRANVSALWCISPVPLPCSQDVGLDNESVQLLLRRGQNRMQWSITCRFSQCRHAIEFATLTCITPPPTPDEFKKAGESPKS